MNTPKTTMGTASADPTTPTSKGSEVTKAFEGMSERDQSFLLLCLKNSNGLSDVDVITIAEKMGSKNHRSVSNRLIDMKKKFGITYSTKSSKVAKSGDDETPKGRKGRTPKTSTPKKATVPKAKKPKLAVEPKTEDEFDNMDGKPNVKVDDETDDDDVEEANGMEA